MGVAAMGRGDAHAACDDFTRVIQEDPGNDKAFELLGNVWSNTDPAKAVVCYQQAVALKPLRTDYRIALAAELTRIDDLPSLNAAAEQLRLVLQIDPDNPQARAGLADLKLRAERLIRQNPAAE
jgi:cytochrome c-type biogenesis protein CcmH/NrfG